MVILRHLVAKLLLCYVFLIHDYVYVLQQKKLLLFRYRNSNRNVAPHFARLSLTANSWIERIFLQRNRYRNSSYDTYQITTCLLFLIKTLFLALLGGTKHESEHHVNSTNVVTP